MLEFFARVSCTVTPTGTILAPDTVVPPLVAFGGAPGTERGLGLSLQLTNKLTRLTQTD